MLFASDHAENHRTTGQETGFDDQSFFDFDLIPFFAALRLFAWADDTQRGQPWA
ncbi:hypothetical protein ANTHELSMS3_03753 [Antarctobacter heliothermus]|uniref:Uncharacterized protein n=1 Tax=Antarctobacter heliothermus TaxID=74033 RepID=A0A222E850_9RHOB|nr:hypothetical protein [Antarctobacter heliothermus]ASP22375.1 hypothetical protein ANTHELSMS3_03753 [Antarctobacter heliothermus]|tara:strand:- start:183 stop:344 length:162 start_codon:yes stop_codon:yes gene_type:complete